MKPTIVAAVDKRTPEAVIATSGELAARLDARLVLVHVQGDPPLLPGSVADRERARSRLNRAAMKLLRRAAARLPAEIDVEYRSELGPVVSRLSRVADETDALLLVTGVRHRGMLATSLLGSISHELSRRSLRPLLIVPNSQEAGNDRSTKAEASTVVVGVDGSAEAAEAAAFADKLASAFGDDLLLVHGFDAPGRIPGEGAAGDSEDVYVPGVMRSALSRVRAHARYVIERGPAAYVLPEVAAREQARFIVIGSQDHHRYQPLSATSETAQLPRHTSTPVLVVRGEGASDRLPARAPALAVAA